jgi:hypothetical protein
VSAAELPAPQIGRILIAAGLLTEEQLAQALEEQERTGKRLGEIIVQRGFISGPALANALAEQHGGVLKTEYGFASGLGGVVARRAASEAGASVSPLRPPDPTPLPQLRTVEPPAAATPQPEVEAQPETPAPSTSVEPLRPPADPEPVQPVLRPAEAPAPEPEPQDEPEPLVADGPAVEQSAARAPVEPLRPPADPEPVQPLFRPAVPFEPQLEPQPVPPAEMFVTAQQTEPVVETATPDHEPEPEPEPAPPAAAAGPLTPIGLPEPQPEPLEPAAETPTTAPPPQPVVVETTIPEPEPEPVAAITPPAPIQEFEPQPEPEPEPEPEAARGASVPDDRDPLLESLRDKVEAQEQELARLREQLEQERARKDVQVHVWSEGQQAPVAEAPAQPESYLLCVPTPAGYVLLDRIGVLPTVGEAVEIPEENASFTVTKVVRLPRNGRPCAYLQRA